MPIGGLYCSAAAHKGPKPLLSDGGEGNPLCPGKDHLLLLDFLWHTERHELCHPASLICENEEVAQRMTENLEKDAGCPVDIEEAEKQASEDVVAQREEALAKQLQK